MENIFARNFEMISSVSKRIRKLSIHTIDEFVILPKKKLKFVSFKRIMNVPESPT